MQLQTVALVGGLGLSLGVALVGRLQPSQTVETRSGPRTSDARPLGTEPGAPLTEQLRLKLQQKPPAPRPDRNPFTFSARATRPPLSLGRGAPMAAPMEETPAPVPVEPPRPGDQYRLSGMAATQAPGGVVWTAMVHDGQGLLYVQRGDRLPDGFEVVDVQETWLMLRDPGGSERTLRLP